MRYPEQVYKRVSTNQIYSTWQNMKARCYRPTNGAYKYYGARGITVCKRWHDFHNFVDDMGVRPFKGASLDRINNNLGYCPTNVRWATMKTQARNKRSNTMVTIQGHTACIAEQAEIHGVDQSIISLRHNKGATGDALIEDRSPHRNFTYNGKTQCIRDWEKELGFKRDTLWARIKRRGMTIEEAINTPLKGRKKDEPDFMEEETTNFLD